ncbi:GMC oxidoreductase, partial [Elusimicrobiota bacterium]
LLWILGPILLTVLAVGIRFFGLSDREVKIGTVEDVKIEQKNDIIRPELEQIMTRKEEDPQEYGQVTKEEDESEEKSFEDMTPWELKAFIEDETTDMFDALDAAEELIRKSKYSPDARSVLAELDTDIFAQMVLDIDKAYFYRAFRIVYEAYLVNNIYSEDDMDYIVKNVPAYEVMRAALKGGEDNSGFAYFMTDITSYAPAKYAQYLNQIFKKYENDANFQDRIEEIKIDKIRDLLEKGVFNKDEPASKGAIYSTFDLLRAISPYNQDASDIIIRGFNIDLYIDDIMSNVTGESLEEKVNIFYILGYFSRLDIMKEAIHGTLSINETDSFVQEFKDAMEYNTKEARNKRSNIRWILNTLYFDFNNENAKVSLDKIKEALRKRSKERYGSIYKQDFQNTLGKTGIFAGIMIPFFGRSNRTRRTRKTMPDKDKKEGYDFDYIIIGSGFGGSVSALRLTEKGYNVGVLEMGKRYRPQDFPKTNWNLPKSIWNPLFKLHGIMRMRVFRHFFGLGFVGVGGGSLGYGATLFRPDEKIWENPKLKGLVDWKNVMPGHYATAERMLGVVENPFKGRVDEIMYETAERLGIDDSVHPTRLGIYFGEEGKKTSDPFFEGKGPKERTGCNLCGGCFTGCSNGSKNSLDMNYLYLAENMEVNPATIIPETRVIDVRPITGKEDGSDGYEIITKSSTKYFSKKQVFRTRGVVFSAGVMGTVDLLSKAKVKGSLPNLSGQIGEYVRINEESILGVRMQDDDISGRKGPAIGSAVRKGDTNIETSLYPDGSDAISLLSTMMVHGNSGITRFLGWIWYSLLHPKTFFRILNPVGFAKQAIILLCMKDTDGHIRMKRRRSFLSPFKKRLDTVVEGDMRISADNPEAQEFAYKMAALTKGDVLTAIPALMLNIPTTAHILGGATMGSSEKDGVIDGKNRVFNYKNMFVIDGSAVSVNPGVNPSLTITALAEHAMSHFEPVDETGWHNKDEIVSLEDETSDDVYRPVKDRGIVRSIKIGFIAAAGAYALRYLAAYITSLISDTPMEELVQEYSGLPDAVSTILPVPVYEEIFFTAGLAGVLVYLFYPTLRKYSYTVAAFAGAFVFAMAHGGPYLKYMSTLIASFVKILLFVKYGLLTSIAMHGFFNIFTNLHGKFNSLELSIVHYSVLGAILFTGSFYLWKSIKDIRKDNRNKGEREFTTYKTGFIGALVPFAYEIEFFF